MAMVNRFQDRVTLLGAQSVADGDPEEVEKDSEEEEDQLTAGSITVTSCFFPVTFVPFEYS